MYNEYAQTFPSRPLKTQLHILERHAPLLGDMKTLLEGAPLSQRAAELAFRRAWRSFFVAAWETKMGKGKDALMKQAWAAYVYSRARGLRV
eukprot:6949899-Alexandrium_andersonii.AAC.1